MKKWAKILVWIGIIWAILVLIGLILVYFQVVQLADALSKANAAGADTSNIKSSMAELINLNNPFTSLIPFFIILGIPSWIMFIIAAIWGRTI